MGTTGIKRRKGKRKTAQNKTIYIYIYIYKDSFLDVFFEYDNNDYLRIKLNDITIYHKLCDKNIIYI